MPSYPRHGLRRTAHRPGALFISLALAVGGLAACSDANGPEQTVDTFLAGWRDGDLHQVGFLNTAGEKIPAADVTAAIRQLSGDLARTPPTLRRAGSATITAGTATVQVRVDWPLSDSQHWTYSTAVALKHGADDRWQVIWEPRIVQDKLTPGDQLTLVRQRPQRATVLDGAGQPIVTARPVVVVGVQPEQVTDVTALVKQLDAAFKAVRPALDPPIDLTSLPTRLSTAKPDAFVEVVTLRKDAYLQIKSRVYELPGTKFREEQLQLAPTREFARALLGTVDPARREDIDARPDRYAAGDLVGHGGLQGAFDEQLRGSAGVSVVISRKGPDGQVAPTGVEVFRRQPEPGTPLRTTLDVATQNAADAALRGQPLRAALVAMRISDGRLLAVANGPHGGAENLAFAAQVPPGSTFKMVSALALLDRGAVQLDTPVACPRTFTVDGRSFTNSEHFELGTVPFRVDFGKSCNTAFAALAPKLGDDGLVAAGRSLGLEGDWQVGLDAFTGKVSRGGSAVERAAAAFGQGTTLVSPLAMAAATAAVARGQWQPPHLIASSAAPASPGPRLTATSVEPLRTMMREVVLAGTATALRDVPGQPVYGKTGTAEYDNDPAHTHAWFVGWQGDVAFAVFVEKGGSSTATAVPIAERFLRGIPAA